MGSDRAAIVRKRKPMSAETKAKIGAALRGHVHSAEFCALMSAARKGKPTRPCSMDTRAAISAAKKGQPQSPSHRAANSSSHKGHTPTVATRAALSRAATGRKRATFSDEWRQRIGSAQVGRKQSAATKAKRAASLKRAWEEGRKTVGKVYRYTSLARALQSCLEQERGVSLEPEVRFGRFTVDLYDRLNHVAYEADGRYWHNRTEAARPGYHAERDAYLFERFALKVFRYTEVDIKAMQLRRAV